MQSLRQARRRRPAGLPLERAARPGDGLSLVSWSRRFVEPIPLPGGGKLVTLKDAIAQGNERSRQLRQRC
jgi:hypothetical protein